MQIPTEYPTFLDVGNLIRSCGVPDLVSLALGKPPFSPYPHTKPRSGQGIIGLSYATIGPDIAGNHGEWPRYSL